MKGLVSFNENDYRYLRNAGWDSSYTQYDNLKDGNFNVCLPLSMLMGFAEDFKKILLNVRQELVLIRSNSDDDALTGVAANEKMKVYIDKIIWKVPHVSVADSERLTLLNYIDRGVELEIGFRGWELHEYPLLQHTWPIKSATQLEKPRYIIFGLQTERRNKADKNSSQFDHCNLTNTNYI